MRKVWLLIAVFFLMFVLSSCGDNENIAITFEENGGTEIDDVDLSINSTTVDFLEPSKEGFIFDGWFIDAALTQPFTIAALLTQSGNLTLYAKWTANVVQHTITFQSNGGSAVTAITADSNSTIVRPTNPTKAGNTFAGWYSDIALSTAYVFTTMPTSDITLYAKWSINNSTISFEENGGSAVADITQAIGSAVIAPISPTKTDHTFVGWYSDVTVSNVYTFSTMPSSNITLYAKWSLNSSTMSFEVNGGSLIASITQRIGSTVIAPANPTKADHTFAGWYSDITLTTPFVFTATVGFSFTVMTSSDITLYAKWTINNSTISFEENGGTLVTDITQAIASTVTIPTNPTKVGNIFAGWYNDIALTTAYTFTVMPSSNITLYAKWNVNSYMISFEENGGSSILDITQGYGTSVIQPTHPIKDGYTFTGWYSDIATANPYTFTTMPSSNITLYAKWSVNSYTMSFEENGGSIVTDITQNYGSSVVQPTNPTKEDNIFAGWYSDISLTTPYSFTVMPSSNITLYAKWNEIIDAMSLAEFKGGTAGATYWIQGVVLMPQFQDAPIMIADETGVLCIYDDVAFEIGQEIMLQAVLSYYEGVPVVWTDGVLNYQVYNENAINPLAPSQMTIDDFYAMDITDVNNWGLYVEITGYIQIEQDYSYYPLLAESLNGGDAIPFAPTYLFRNASEPFFGNPNDVFLGYQGLRFVINGFFFPTFVDEDSYDPDRILLVPEQDSITLDYINEQEKLDAFIAYVITLLDEDSFHPYDYINLIESVPVIDATITWELITGTPGSIDFNTNQLQEVTIYEDLVFRATITVGSLTSTHDFTVSLYPYMIIPIEDFYNLRDGEYGKLVVTVAEVIPGFGIILQEGGSSYYLFAYGYDDLNEGDVVEIFGTHSFLSGYIELNGYAEHAYVTLYDTNQKLALISWETTLEDLSQRSTDFGNILRYNTIRGRLMYAPLSDQYYLTDGVNTLFLFFESYSLETQFESFVGQDVEIKLFNYEFYYTEMGPVWTGLVIDGPNIITGITLTNSEILGILEGYIKDDFDYGFLSGLDYLFSTTHPIYGGEIVVTLDSGSTSYATINGTTLSLVDSEESYTVTLDISITYNSQNVTMQHIITVYPYTDDMGDHHPGSKGLLPFVDYTFLEGQFGGLYVEKVDREPGFMGGSDMIVELRFPTAESMGFSSYTLQYQDPITLEWHNVLYYDDPLTTSGDNFSITMTGASVLRLISDTGIVSNVVTVENDSIDTYFAGWSLDYGMFLTGIMTPFVGYGLQLDELTIIDFAGNPVLNCYTLQWYRVNPTTFEMTAITGATQHLYQTTAADVGYIIMVEAKGDNVNAGGVQRIMAPDIVNIQNQGYITSASTAGFYIGFDYDVTLSDLDNLEVYDENWQIIEDYEVQTTSNPAVYYISCDLRGVDSVIVTLVTYIFVLGEDQAEYDYFSYGVYADLRNN